MNKIKVAHYQFMNQMRILLIITAVWSGLLGCSKRASTKIVRVVNNRQLTSEWHREEEAKIDSAVNELRALGKWEERWDKFSKLGSFGWKDNMDCGDATHSMPCMSGGYTFSQQAFEQLKRGDLSHNPHNTVEESFHQQQALIQTRQGR